MTVSFGKVASLKTDRDEQGTCLYFKGMDIQAGEGAGYRHDLSKDGGNRREGTSGDRKVREGWKTWDTSYNCISE